MVIRNVAKVLSAKVCALSTMYAVLLASVFSQVAYAQAPADHSYTVKTLTGTYKMTAATSARSGVSSVTLSPNGGAKLSDKNGKVLGTFSSQLVGSDGFKATLVRADGTHLDAAFTISSIGSGIKMVGTFDGQPVNVTYDGNGKPLAGSQFPEPRASDVASVQALQEAYNTRVQMHVLTDKCQAAIAIMFIAAAEGGIGFPIAAIYYWHTCKKK